MLAVNTLTTSNSLQSLRSDHPPARDEIAGRARNDRILVMLNSFQHLLLQGTPDQVRGDGRSGPAMTKGKPAMTGLVIPDLIRDLTKSVQKSSFCTFGCVFLCLNVRLRRFCTAVQFTRLPG